MLRRSIRRHKIIAARRRAGKVRSIAKTAAAHANHARQREAFREANEPALVEALTAAVQEADVDKVLADRAAAVAEAERQRVRDELTAAAVRARVERDEAHRAVVGPAAVKKYVKAYAPVAILRFGNVETVITWSTADPVMMSATAHAVAMAASEISKYWRGRLVAVHAAAAAGKPLLPVDAEHLRTALRNATQYAEDRKLSVVTIKRRLRK